MHRCTWGLATLQVPDSAAADNDIVRDFMGDVDRTCCAKKSQDELRTTRAKAFARVLQMLEELRRAVKKLRQNSDGH